MLPLDSLPTPASTLLVAVSGGRDSVALVHLLLANGFTNLVLCHVDHGLRDSSTRDADFVKKLASTHKLPLESTRIDVAHEAETKKISLEHAARHCRYDFFRQCSQKHHTAHLCVAHHANDQAETVLFNLLRGSHGIKGMSEVSHRDELVIHRPLLSLSRAAITAYCTAQDIDFCEDETNAEPIATRNRLRNEALPLLSDILGRDIVPILSRAAEAAADAELDISLYLDPQGRLFLPLIHELPTSFQNQVLHRFLQKHSIPNISTALIDSVLEMLDLSAPAKINLPGGKFLRRKESRLFIQEA